MICNLETTGIQSYIKLLGWERSQKKDLRSHLGIDLETSSFTEGHAPANYTKKKSLIPPLRKVRFQPNTKKGQKYLISGQSRQLMQETRKFALYREIINWYTVTASLSFSCQWICCLLSHVFNKDMRKSFVQGNKQQGAKVITVNNNSNSQEGGGVGGKNSLQV